MKKMMVASAMLALSSMALVSCEQSAAPPAGEVTGKPGVTVTNGRLVLPAVAGNPAALYFDIVNNSDGYAVVRMAEIPGAKEIDMHETLTTNGTAQMANLAPVNLLKGKPVKFEPGGKHFMVMGLSPVPKVGDTTEVTLTFAGGDKSSFAAKVEGPGGKN